MPLIATSTLPTYERLKEEGHTILSSGRAMQQDIRELHIGLLNMMPDAALEATERQFLRLISNSNLIVQLHIHLLSLDSIARGPEAKQHIKKYYQPFEKIKEKGLDGLVITGTNITEPDIADMPFWDELCGVFDWASEYVTSTLSSCLATHALVQHLYGLKRQPLDQKCWGIYSHDKKYRQHPLMRAVNTRFFVPHSRFNKVSAAQLEQAGLPILVESDEAGVHMAVSPDGFRFVLCQGHLEYDTVSLLKEYKREIARYIKKQREDYPPYPENYFCPQSIAILEDYKAKVLFARNGDGAMPLFPEQEIDNLLYNIWRDSSKSIVSNWLGLIYQITHVDRNLPYMDGIDADDPLGLKKL